MAQSFPRAMAFGNVISVPRRNFHDNGAWLFDHALASQAGVELQVGSHVEAIGFIVIHLIQAIGAFLYPDMAGGAGAVAAAGMVQKDAVVESNVQNGLGFAVLLVGQLAVLELDGLAFR